MVAAALIMATGSASASASGPVRPAQPLAIAAAKTPAQSVSLGSGVVGSAVIDAAAVDRVAPADAVVDVRAAFGARGDGRSDDSAAIQAAISAGLSSSNRDKILYFPAGTYLVSRPLQWRLANGSWSSWLTLQGQNRDHTIIKLADAAPGFNDPSHPQPVLRTGSQNADAADGSGNRAFNNFIFDLTIDIGTDNPGADGIDYLANNRGAIRNVALRAPTGSGNTGITMTRRWPGPCLLDNIRITGFATGIQLGRWEYSLTAENIRLTGQRRTGIDNQNNVVNLRNLISHNQVPAITNSTADGLITVLDSQLLDGSPTLSAITNNGAAFLRNITITGYTTTVLDKGTPRTPAGTEWSTTNPRTPNATPPASLTLPTPEPPSTPDYPAQQWAGVADYGGLPNDNHDDTTALQAALNSGKPVIYLRPGWYELTAPLTIPDTVREIIGFEATLDATRGAYTTPSTTPVFTTTTTTTTPLTLTQLLFKTSPTTTDITRTGTRPIQLRDLHLAGNPFHGTPGQLFLTDIDGGTGWHLTPGQQIWARQLDTEQPGTKITNTGATLWILGLKTEQPGTAIATTDNAHTELLGALLYPSTPITDNTPAFTNTNATQSLTFAISATDPTRQYKTLITTTHQTTTQTITTTQAQPRGTGTMLSLYGD